MPADRRPNIVLCIVDQLRAFETGCYGNSVIRTPNIDRLAAEGALFETAVTNFPVCMAARTVLLSGQHNRTCTGGVTNVAYQTRPGDVALPEYPFPGRPHLCDTSLPEALGAQGYDTAVIGKWHIHSWPNDVGFGSYLIPRVHHCHSGQSFTQDGGPEFVPPGFSVDFEAERVEGYIRERARARSPFFLYYSISPPHCPVADAPERYLRMYDPADIPLRPNVDPSRKLDRQDYWFKVYRYDFRHYNLQLPYADRLPEGYDLRSLIAEYYGLTTWADDAVGRMLAALDKAGLSENTIVVFTSDHGDNLGSHGLVQKGGPTEESIRIPLAIRWPGNIPAGRRVTDRVPSLADVMPSLLELSGSSIPGCVQGRSFAPALAADPRPAAIPYSFVETSSGAGIRTPRHLYYVPFEASTRRLGEAPAHYYDMTADPFQMTNLAASAGKHPAARELDEALRAWDASTPWMEG